MRKGMGTFSSPVVFMSEMVLLFLFDEMVVVLSLALSVEQLEVLLMLMISNARI